MLTSGAAPLAETAPLCPRCGPGEDFLSPERVAALGADIPVAPHLAAEEGVCQRRLAACAGCDALREKVLCAYCGCFVQFRARPALGYCPHPAGNKWK